MYPPKKIQSSHLKENTYVDNLMQTGGNNEELMRFKEESTAIRESARFPVHKWESNMSSFLKVKACQTQARSLDTRGIKMMTHRSCLQSFFHKNIR